MLASTLYSVGAGIALTSPLWVDRLFADNGIIFTKPDEGTFQAVVNGNEFSHFVLAYSGHKFKGTGPDEERWEIVSDPEHKKNPFNIFGWRLVGIPFAQTIYNYKLSWRELQQVGKKSEIVARTNEMTNFGFATRFPYAMVLPDGETYGKDGEIIPVTLEYVAIIRITNPYKALFMNEDWPQIIESILNEIAKDYALSKTYEELVSEQTSGHKSGGFSDRILCPQDIKPEDDHVPETGPDPEKSIQEWVTETYGITITNAYLLNVDPLPEWRELTQKRTQAAIEADVLRTEAAGRADAIKLEADADAHATRVDGEAKAKAYKSVASAVNSHKDGFDIFRIQTLGDVGEAGNTVVVAPDLLTPAAAEILTKKKPKREDS